MDPAATVTGRSVCRHGPNPHFQLLLQVFDFHISLPLAWLWLRLAAEVAELLVVTVTQEVKRRGALGN